MMKKLIYVISLLFVLFLLAGCSNKHKKISEAEKQQFTVEDLAINTKK